MRSSTLLLVAAAASSLSLWIQPSFGGEARGGPPTTPPTMRAPAKEGRKDALQMPSGLQIEGTYMTPTSVNVKIERLLGDIYHVVSPEGWEGVGILEGSIYRGVFRYRGRDPKLNGAMGLHVIDWSNLHEPRVRTTNAAAMADTSNETWHRIEASREPAYANPEGQNRNIVVAPPNSSERPKFGEYVYVDELPEAITKVPRAYPDEARRAGIEGTVMVQCLVLEDGSVGDTRVVKSVPELDEAAVACVRQWRFQPARSKGRPVAVWVAVPVRFSLH